MHWFCKILSLCFLDVVGLFLVFIKLFPVNFMGKGVFVAGKGGFWDESPEISCVSGICNGCRIPLIKQSRPEINKKVAFDATFLFIFVELGFKRQNSFVMFERFPRSTQCVGCGAFVTILLRNTCKIYSLSPRPKIKEKLWFLVFFV